MPAASPLALTIPTLVSASIVLVTVAAWVWKPLQRALILNPYVVRHRLQVHRLVTAGWVHADAFHLLFNLVTLYFFADLVVAVLGPALFLVLYGSAVVVAHVPTTLRHMKNPTYNSLGASGAVSAVMLSAILTHPGLRVSFLLPLPIPGLFYALGFLAYNAFQSVRSRDGVNHDAHFAGAIYGALFTFALEPGRVLKTLGALF